MIDTIIFLPFAGGTKYGYRSFIKLLPPYVKYTFAQLRGRADRSGESFDESLDDIIEDIYQQCKDQLSGNYIIYGHSMGALLGYLLAKYLFIHKKPLPNYMVFTGFGAPSMIELRPEKLHQLDSRLFWKKIGDYGGTPNDILEDEDLRKIVEPALRADIKTIETYIHDHAFRLNVPILVVTGKKEEIRQEEIEAWRHVTTAKVKTISFEGNHFFIFGNEHRVLEEMFSFGNSLEIKN